MTPKSKRGLAASDPLDGVGGYGPPPSKAVLVISYREKTATLHVTIFTGAGQFEWNSVCLTPAAEVREWRGRMSRNVVNRVQEQRVLWLV